MASITELARVPEILFYIIRHISSKDTLNLGLTCKALLPACYRSLWTNLSLVPSSNHYRKTWPGLQLLPKFKSEAYKVVWDYWLNAPGLQYTKRVDFGRILNKDCKESEILIQLLEVGKLDISCVDISITLEDVTAGDGLSAFQHLRKYAELKSLSEFKIQLRSDVVHSFPELVDLTKVTKLALDIPYSSSGDDNRWVAPNASTGEKIRELTSVLARAINLTYFSWKAKTPTGKRCSISAISKDLEGLQAAFTNFKRLKSLKIEGYLFHPSFFVNPPNSVKNLVLNCITSAKWWQDFAACPLTGVRDLRFHSLADPGQDRSRDVEGFLSVEESIPVHTIKLGRVAARDLEISLCFLKPVPRDLGLCLLKSNPKLKGQYCIEFARREIKHTLRECHTRFEMDWHLSKGFAENLYIKGFLNNSEPKTESDIVEEYTRMAVLGEIENGYIYKWDRAKQRAENLGFKSKAGLEKQLWDSVDRAIHHYTHKFMESEEDVDEVEFTKECIRIFDNEAQGGRQYSVARETARQVEVTVNKFRQVFDSLRKTVHSELAQKVLGGVDINDLALMRYWVDRAVPQFQDLGLGRLSLSEDSKWEIRDSIDQS
ncbi:hypothetical protein TWF281_006958 [Arthrobotrys megalospora]